MPHRSSFPDSRQAPFDCVDDRIERCACRTRCFAGVAFLDGSDQGSVLVDVETWTDTDGGQRIRHGGKDSPVDVDQCGIVGRLDDRKVQGHAGFDSEAADVTGVGIPGCMYPREIFGGVALRCKSRGFDLESASQAQYVENVTSGEPAPE